MYFYLPFAATLFGSLVEPIDGQKPISAIFSTASHNRIAIEEGAVEKIFGDSALFSIQIDPITGNAFVNVLSEITETPATLSVITSTGLVQDLLITTREGPSESLILQEKDTEFLPKTETSFSATIATLNTILDHQIPFGFGQLSKESSLDLPSPLEAVPTQVLEGPFEIITAYRIINHGTEPIVLSPDAFKKESGAWAFLTAREIGAQEESTLLVGHPKDGAPL